MAFKFFLYVNPINLRQNIILNIIKYNLIRSCSGSMPAGRVYHRICYVILFYAGDRTDKILMGLYRENIPEADYRIHLDNLLRLACQAAKNQGFTEWKPARMTGG